MRIESAEDGAKNAKAPSFAATEPSKANASPIHDTEDEAARQQSDLADMIARTTRVIAASDLRDAIRRSAPADLASMGIDRPDLRWAASRAFIRAARAATIDRVDAGIRRMILLDRIAASWRRRGSPGFGPDESDVADACLAYRRIFRERAPSLDAISHPRFGPTSEEMLIRLARDQASFEAAIGARNREAAA